MKELLLLLSSYPFNPAEKEQLRDLLSKVQDWHKLVELINTHGITALAAHNINASGSRELVPEKTLMILDDGLRQNILRNTWLTQRWKEVNDILSSAGIKHVLLKGMALEYTVYGAQGLRQMNDNDILVRKDEALNAWNLLQEHGFKPETIKSSLHRKIISEIGKHLPGLTKDNYTIEIHLRLFKDQAANEQLSEVFDTSTEILIDGIKGSIPEKNIHLAFLYEHLSEHLQAGEAQLRLFTDMELLRPGSAPEIPEGFIENPKRPEVSDHVKNAYRNEFRSIPGGHRLRYLIGDLFPSIEWMKKRHGCGAFRAILFYPRRIGKILWLMS